MRQRYTDVAAFNASYATTFATWDELAAAENWRSAAAPVSQAERDGPGREPCSTGGLHG